MKNIVFVFLFFPLVFFAQDRHLIKGRLVCGSIGVKDALVVNFNAEKETRTDSLGNFTLLVQTGDLLVFTDHKIAEKKIRYTPDLVKNNFVIVEVEMLAHELEEVVINKNNINSEALGLILKGQKQYTPAEKKLKTAGDFKPIHLLGLLGGSLAVDPIINAISGRTKMLKKEVLVERKELLMDKINNIYTEEAIINEFKIPENYVKGFIYYIVEDKDFAAAIKAKNNVRAKFLISGLSVEYLKLIADDK